MEIKHNFKTMFVFPVAEDELESVVHKLREKSSAGFDVIPEYLVMKSIQYIKRSLAHIFNASLKSGIFPNKMKTVKVQPLYKKVMDLKFVVTYQYLFYQFLQKLWKNSFIIG
jgi:hypothetical protein